MPKEGQNLKNFRHEYEQACLDLFRVAAVYRHEERAFGLVTRDVGERYAAYNSWLNGLGEAAYQLRGEAFYDRVCVPLYDRIRVRFENGDFDPKEDK